MVSFNRFFASVYLAVVYATTASAAPWPVSSKHSTHRVREVGSNGLKLVTFHPAASYETYGTEGVSKPESFGRSDLNSTAVAFVENKLQLSSDAVEYESGFTAGSTSYAYVKQKHAGISFANSVANIALKDDKIVAFGHSFTKPAKIADSKPTVSVETAIANAEKALDGTYNKWATELQYLNLEDGSAALTHVVQIQNDEKATWYQAFVDAHSGEVLSIVDFVSKASYRVLPIEKEYLTEGFETLTDPQNAASSPQGWHNDGTTSTTITAGNNVITYKGSTSATTSQSSAGLNFVYTQDATKAPTTAVNVDAARTNTFYIVNAWHDLTYLYGFNEKAYNFQQSNFDKGGKGNDRVQVSVQDNGGTNNANFATPPDGQKGQMRMYLWTLTSPQRDGALENDIVVHEMTHGLSNRLTGGGTGSCLQSNEAGGMGEGWSDALADWTEQDGPQIVDYDLGTYVYTQNIRSYAYSTSATTNPLRYSSIQTRGEVHDIGEIWANLLHNVLAALVSELGFSKTAKTDPSGTEGNVVWLHLFIDALALQPCNPTFLSARDAWIQADVNRYNGSHKCSLWKAFASRGLGVNAKDHNDDSTLPSGC